MAFIFYSSLALEFLSLAAGTSLFIWALQTKGNANGSALATFIGILITIFSFIAVIATLVYGGQAWMAGRFNAAQQMQQKAEQLKELDQMEKMIDRMKASLKPQKTTGSSQ